MNDDIKLPQGKQENLISKVFIEVTKKGKITVKLTGPHMRKLLLTQAIRALKLEYRRTIILFRSENIANRIKEEIENKRETNIVKE